MAKITTGSTFGLNTPETLICYSVAHGESEKEIFSTHYGVTSQSTPGERARARKKFRALCAKEAFQECYRAIVKQETQGLYSMALKRLGEQLEMDAKDPKFMWVVNKAATDIIGRYHDAIMGGDKSEVTIRVEGMPLLGKPEDMDGG